MTRKDYIVLADALYQAQDEAKSPSELAGMKRMQECIADALAEDNPRFDRVRFGAAVLGVPAL